MGSRGPAPARSDERRRRNKPVVEVEKIPVDGEVARPGADDSWHPVAAEFYRSLSDSGQSRFFEPSDWQAAFFCASLMSKCMAADSPNAQLVGQVRGIMADLLTTEGARRRAGVELVRKKPGESAEPGTPSSVSTLADRRTRLADAS